MSGELIRAPSAFAGALTSAAGYALAEKAGGTRRVYRAAVKDFYAWCEGVGAAAVPASAATVAAYLASLADSGLKISTIDVRAAAIGYAHSLGGYDSPLAEQAVKAVLSGIRRTIGAPKTAKAPATAKIVAAMARRLPDSLAGKRDRALILIGFAAALRRSELVALDVGAIERAGDGVFIHIGRSKTDQEARGEAIAVPAGKKLRAVEALDAWLSAAGITGGPAFRSIGKSGRLGGRLSDRAVALIVKAAAARAKLDPATFAGHSLRAGFVTSALEDGADLLKVMDVTRHREVKTLKDYDRRAKAFKDHAGAGFL